MISLQARRVLLVLSFVALGLGGVGCSSPGSESSSGSGAGEAVAADEADLRVAGGVYLKNGADVTKDDEPDTLRAVAEAGDAEAKVTDASLATCTVKKNASLSTAKRTVFDLTLEYEIDDGWNGCTFALTATGYEATLTAGFTVGD